MFNNMSYSTLLAFAALVAPTTALKYSPVLVAHASTGCVAWVFLMPLGAILFSLARYPAASNASKPNHIFWIHAAIQSVAIFLAIANFGLGTYIALKYHKELMNAHTIVGTVVFILMFLQPLLGFIHHARFKALRRASALPYPPPCDRAISTSWTVFGLVHRWLGRATIILAMINGGLGFDLAKKVPMIYSYQGEIAYGVIAAAVFVVWMGVVFGGYRKRAARVTITSKGNMRERIDSEDAIFVAGSDMRGFSDHIEEKDVRVA